MNKNILSSLLLGLFIISISSSLFAQSSDISTGKSLFEERKFAEAKTFFEKFTESNPENKDGYYHYGRSCMAVNDFENAVKSFEKAVKLDETNSEYYTRLGDAYGNRINEVNMLSKMRMAGKIKSAYEKAIELDPENIDPRWGLMQFHLNAPGIAGGDKKIAEKQASEIKKIDLKRGYRAYIQFYRREQKTDLLKNEIQEAIGSDPEDMYFQFQMGTFYQDNNETDKAIELFNNIYENDPDNTQAAYQLGYIYVNKKEYDRGFELFETLINKETVDIGALYQFARISAISGEKPDKGIGYMKEYLKHEPTAGNPSHAAAYWRMGLIYEHKNDLEAAVKALEKSLELDPKYNAVKRDLKRIKEKKF